MRTPEGFLSSVRPLPAGTLKEAMRNPILVVEDDPDIAEACRDLLEEEGYRVEVARTAADALNYLTHERKPCLVLLDLRMPGFDEDALLDAVERKLPPRPPIVIATALRFKVPPRHRVLHKPYDLGELLQLVREHGCERAPLSVLA